MMLSRAQLDRYARLFRDGSAASRRNRAIATLAGMIGALTLARAVGEPNDRGCHQCQSEVVLGGRMRDTSAAEAARLAGDRAISTLWKARITGISCEKGYMTLLLPRLPW